MKNSLMQIAIILLAGLIVTGGLWSIGLAAGAAEQTGEGRLNDHDDHEGRGGVGRNEPFTLGSAGGFTQTLVPITVIISLFVFLPKTFAKVKNATPKQERDG